MSNKDSLHGRFDVVKAVVLSKPLDLKITQQKEVTHARIACLIAFFYGRQNVVSLGHDINRSDSRIIGKVPPARHRLMREDVKLLLLCGLIQTGEIQRFIAALAKSDPNSWPAIHVFYGLHSILSKDFVYVYVCKSRCINHTMVTDKDDVNDISEIPGHKL